MVVKLLQGSCKRLIYQAQFCVFLWRNQQQCFKAMNLGKIVKSFVVLHMLKRNGSHLHMVPCNVNSIAVRPSAETLRFSKKDLGNLNYVWKLTARPCPLGLIVLSYTGRILFIPVSLPINWINLRALTRLL